VILGQKAAQANGAQPPAQLDDGRDTLLGAEALAQVGQHLEHGFGIVFAQPMGGAGTRDIILRNKINALPPAGDRGSDALAAIGKDGTQKIVETHKPGKSPTADGINREWQTPLAAKCGTSHCGTIAIA
jgi:hypothetical protein